MTRHGQAGTALPPTRRRAGRATHVVATIRPTTPVPPTTGPPASSALSTIKAQLATLHEQQQVLLHVVSRLATRDDVYAAWDVPRRGAP